MKIKKLFETPKKAVVTSLCFIAAVGVIGSGSLFAVEVMAENKAIGKVEAEKIALKDANLIDSQVRMERTEFEYENGQYVYDVEFTTNEKEYDYWIDAYEGRVVYKEVEAADDRLQPTTKPEVTIKPHAVAETVPTVNPQVTTESKATTHEKRNEKEAMTASKARSKALADAGLTSDKVTFTKTELDKENDILVYDIEFYSSTREYEYEMNAYNGKVLSKSSEELPSKLDSTDTYIGVDKAKAIAVKHAGRKLSEVRFTKAKLENDHGEVEYEIEFYYNNLEYEYTIDASKGTVLDFETEEDD